MIKWSRRIERRMMRICPRCQKPATVLMFENSDSAYLRCYNIDCDYSCSTEAFHRIVEKALEEEGSAK